MTKMNTETLHLPLKAKWYDMIESGEKTEEYREVKPYWVKRLCFTKQQDGCAFSCAERWCMRCEDLGNYMCYPFTKVCFSYGYTKRRMTWEVESICIGYGDPGWGAPKDKAVFIIKLANRIK